MKQSCEKMSPSSRDRMPAYFRALREFLLENRLRVNSEQLARATGFSTSQIRSDLRWNEGAAQRGYGYMVRELYTELAAYLGTGAGYTAVCIGDPDGTAELGDAMFGRCGVRVLAYLPEDREEIWLADRLRELAPDVGVISARCRHPMRNAELFRICRVKGILNYSDSRIEIPGLAVQNHALSDDLLLLCSAMQEKEKEKGE